MTRINLKKPQFCLAAALLWIVLCVIATPVYTTVTLSFQDDPEGEVITTVRRPSSTCGSLRRQKPGGH